MLEIKGLFLNSLKNHKTLISVVIIFSFTMLFGYLIKNYIHLLGYSGILGNSNPKLNYSTNYNISIFCVIYFIYLIFLDSINSYGKFKIDKIVFIKLNLFILVTSIIFVAFTDGNNYRIYIMKERYADILDADPSYVKNKNSIVLLKSIEDNNPKEFIKTLENFDDNIEQNKYSLIKLFEIVNEFFPEKKVMLLSALKDDYFTKKEFKDIKLSILKDIDNKELNTAQIAMIGDLK